VGGKARIKLRKLCAKIAEKKLSDTKIDKISKKLTAMCLSRQNSRSIGKYAE
jgi:hypothetical protein